MKDIIKNIERQKFDTKNFLSLTMDKKSMINKINQENATKNERYDLSNKTQLIINPTSRNSINNSSSFISNEKPFPKYNFKKSNFTDKICVLGLIRRKGMFNQHRRKNSLIENIIVILSS